MVTSSLAMERAVVTCWDQIGLALSYNLHRRNPHRSPLSGGLIIMLDLGLFFSHCCQHLRLPSLKPSQCPPWSGGGGQSAGVYPCLHTSGFILPARPAYTSWRAVWDGQGHPAANESFRIGAQASTTDSVSLNRPVKETTLKTRSRGVLFNMVTLEDRLSGSVFPPTPCPTRPQVHLQSPGTRFRFK